MLTMNVGFALTTIGAWDEALHELTGRHRQGARDRQRRRRAARADEPALLGGDLRRRRRASTPRSPSRAPTPTRPPAAPGWCATARRSASSSTAAASCSAATPPRSPRRARLLKTAAEAYRSTENRDVLPVALGFWAEAERRFGHAEQAVEIAREAARLVEAGAPSLLNEAPIYLALHDACVDVGDLRGARDAMARGIAPLMRRLKGLEGTPYARELPPRPPAQLRRCSPPPRPTAASRRRSSGCSSRPRAEQLRARRRSDPARA